MDAVPSAKRSRPLEADQFVSSAQEVVKFRMLLSTSRDAILSEIEAGGGTTFDGEFFHQHFGEEETIKGYSGLEIDVWFSAHTFHAHIDIKV